MDKKKEGYNKKGEENSSPSILIDIFILLMPK